MVTRKLIPANASYSQLVDPEFAKVA